MGEDAALSSTIAVDTILCSVLDLDPQEVSDHLSEVSAALKAEVGPAWGAACGSVGG